MTPTQKHRKSLMRVCKYFGTQSAIAEALGISKQNVSNWFVGNNVIPEHHARRLENMLQGRVSFYDLRPDCIKRDRIAKKNLRFDD